MSGIFPSYEFWLDRSERDWGQYNDLQFEVLRANGYTGSNPDMFAQWVRDGYPELVPGGDVLKNILSPNGEDYAFFDFTQTDRTFQESFGPTPADDIGEAVGLWLDRHGQGNKTLAEVVSEQSELLVAGEWIMSTAGGTSTATESPDGTLNLTGDGTNQARGDQSFTTVVGKMYRLIATAAGAIALNVGTAQGGGQNINMLFSSGSAVYFVATATTTWVRWYKSAATGTTVVSGISCKLVPSHYALQSTSNARGIRQADGIKYDGSDDNHLTDWLAQAGANCIIAQVTVPETLAATQMVAGMMGPGTGRFRLELRTDGGIQATAGDTLVSVALTAAAGDHRGQTCVIGMATQGTDLKVMSSIAGEAVSTFDGGITTAVPIRIGAMNIDGTPGNFTTAAITKFAPGLVYPTLSQFQQIAAEWAD